ncbi:hypothetical protein DL770_010849 [Monosporascus sp. CRB-9-2]|nr:hypothetical protein DL770_010849 [Monosporascus sp. CRB-9-2]
MEPPSSPARLPVKIEDRRSANTVLWMPQPRGPLGTGAIIRSIDGRTTPELRELLRQHILIDFPAYTPLLEDGDIYPTLAGAGVTLSVRDGVVSFNGARILAGDAIITNGVIHTIDRVLGTPSTPPPVETGAATTMMETLSWKVLVCSFAAVAAAARYFNLV